MSKLVFPLAALIILLFAFPSSASLRAISAPVLKWQNGGCQTTWCRTGWYASPAVADLDNDGKPEIIWTDYRIVVVNGEDGSDQWIVANPGNQRGWASVVVADVNNDGAREIVTAHGNGWLTITNANGTTLSEFPQQPTPGNELRSLAVGDMDANGDL
ncbi:MAG: VCBS repeat-containing protein, partial [Chloroflexi bacterium]|nr:VCBS repeat-containing protein [Chloroflexota bacterium]